MTFSQALAIASDEYRRSALVPVYWSIDEYDCTEHTRSIMRPDVVHVHAENGRVACLGLLAYRIEYEHALKSTGYPPKSRYRCFRGPGGLIRGVLRDGRGVSDLWRPR